MRPIMRERYRKAQEKKGLKVKYQITDPQPSEVKIEETMKPAKNESKPTELKDFDATNLKHTLSSPTAKAVIDAGKDIFKDEDGKPDKIFEYIEKGAKYVPLVLQFVQGMASSYKEWNSQQNQSKAEAPALQAPSGWVSMMPLDRLKYKYNNPEWYEAGVRYDEAMASQAAAGSVNIHYIDPNYRDPQPQRTRASPPMQASAPEPKSLAELSRKYPDPPLLSETKTGDMNERKSDVPADTGGTEQKIEENNTSNNSEGQMKEIQEALQADAAKYVKMGVDYINGMSQKDFENFISKPATILQKVRNPLVKMMIPIHVSQVIKNTSTEDFVKLLKEQCSEKFKWIEKKSKLPIVEDLYEKIRGEFK